VIRNVWALGLMTGSATLLFVVIFVALPLVIIQVSAHNLFVTLLWLFIDLLGGVVLGWSGSGWSGCPTSRPPAQRGWYWRPRNGFFARSYRTARWARRPARHMAVDPVPSMAGPPTSAWHGCPGLRSPAAEPTQIDGLVRLYAEAIPRPTAGRRVALHASSVRKGSGGSAQERSEQPDERARGAGCWAWAGGGQLGPGRLERLTRPVHIPAWSHHFINVDYSRNLISIM
jgi:hypothetical protein